MKTLNVNGQPVEVDAQDSTPLLWVLREHLGSQGRSTAVVLHSVVPALCIWTGVAVRSCVMPLAAVSETTKVTTIEGLSEDGSHPVQRAWAELDVPQCGYCQPGMIMAVSGMLNASPDADDAQIDSQITNICRCGTFQRVREGVHLAKEVAKRAREKRHERVNEKPNDGVSTRIFGDHFNARRWTCLGHDNSPDSGIGESLDEVNAWVHIASDETVTIRIARSEMGQGTLTGLAQLVAEELDCDWNQVTYEFPTPGQNVARERVWGRFLNRRQSRATWQPPICAGGRCRREIDVGSSGSGCLECPSV